MVKLLSSLPIGANIKFGKHSVGSEDAEPIVWIVADSNHSGYPTDSVTLITKKIIDLRAFDAREIDDYNLGFYGGINYGISNLNQWLNSASQNWYSAIHNNDNPPNDQHVSNGTGYAARPGFLYNFTEDERLSLLPTTLTLQTSVGSPSSVTTKVFLASLWELIGSHIASDGSSQFKYFLSNSAVCGLTSQAFTNTLSTKKPTQLTDNWSYMTRSANDAYQLNLSETGTRVQKNSYDGSQGVRPVINVSNKIRVSETTDSDGCYTVIFNEEPIISGTNSNLGLKTGAFSQTYKVNDADNDVVTVTEYIDNVKIRSYVATLDATNTFAVTDLTWRKLSNGTHTLKITATDGIDESTRTFTFTKAVNSLSVQRSTPIASATKPTRLIVTVVKSIPPEAIFKVEACNNGYDTAPTWEDITSSITSGQTHVFSNTVSTSGKWGVNIRVTVDRNGGEGACYISEIGGNFE